MLMREQTFGAQPPVDGYGPGGFRVSGTWRTGGLVIAPSGIYPVAGDPAAAVAALLASDPDLDLLVLGQGVEIAPAPAAIRGPLESAGIGLEHMATPAACRTYNVLLGEERRVAALLIPV
ncbi:MAG: Mth938-like domain-containing protein [Pseudomonadota bacterium]